MGKLGSASHHPLLPYDLTRANGSNGSAPWPVATPVHDDNNRQTLVATG